MAQQEQSQLEGRAAELYERYRYCRRNDEAVVTDQSYALLNHGQHGADSGEEFDSGGQRKMSARLSGFFSPSDRSRPDRRSMR